MENLVVKNGAHYRKSFNYARGWWQRAILQGQVSYSLAGLQGRAKDYFSKYQQSRDNLFRRIEDAGIPWDIEVQAHGRLVIVIGAESTPTRSEMLKSLRGLVESPSAFEQEDGSFIIPASKMGEADPVKVLSPVGKKLGWSLEWTSDDKDVFIARPPSNSSSKGK